MFEDDATFFQGHDLQALRHPFVALNGACDAFPRPRVAEHFIDWCIIKQVTNTDSIIKLSVPYIRIESVSLEKPV